MDDSKGRRRVSKAISKKTLLGIIFNLPETKCTKWLKSLHLEGGKMSSVKLPRMLNEAQTDLAMSDIHSMRVCREFI